MATSSTDHDLDRNNPSWFEVAVGDEEVFMLLFEDGKRLPIEKGNLLSLCRELPALPYLLFGHPRMMESRVVRDRTTDIRVLDLSDYMPRYHFQGVMNVVFGTAPLPRAYDSKAKNLKETLDILGGFPPLNAHFVQLSSEYNPRCPREDTKEMFDWRLTTYRHLDHLPNYDSSETEGERLFNEGFVMVGCDTGARNQRLIHCRKAKVSETREGDKTKE